MSRSSWGVGKRIKMRNNKNLGKRKTLVVIIDI